MKGFLSCLAALAWIGVVIYQMQPRRQQLQGSRNTWLGYRNADGEYELNHETVVRGDYPRAHDEHGAGGFTQQAIDQADRAHTGGHVHCPIHGSACGRAKEVRETGMSQTDQDVARRAVINGAH